MVLSGAGRDGVAKTSGKGANLRVCPKVCIFFRKSALLFCGATHTSSFATYGTGVTTTTVSLVTLQRRVLQQESPIERGSGIERSRTSASHRRYLPSQPPQTQTGRVCQPRDAGILIDHSIYEGAEVRFPRGTGLVRGEAAEGGNVGWVRALRDREDANVRKPAFERCGASRSWRGIGRHVMDDETRGYFISRLECIEI